MVKRGMGECRARACQCDGTGKGDPDRRLGDFLNHRNPHGISSAVPLDLAQCVTAARE